MDIGGTLRSWRERRGIRAADVARALGLNTTTFSKYELGRRDVPYDLLEPWGRALGLLVELRITPVDNLQDPTVDALRAVAGELLPHERQVIDGIVALLRARQSAAMSDGGRTAMSASRR